MQNPEIAFRSGGYDDDMNRLVPFAVSILLVTAACTPASNVPSTTTGAPDPTTTVVHVTTTAQRPVTTATTEAPDGFGGEVTIGVDFPVETLNPFAPNAFGVRPYGNLVWATVYDIHPDTWDRIPDVVEAMPSKSGDITINDDGTMSVTYRIVNGATWSDGEIGRAHV